MGATTTFTMLKMSTKDLLLVDRYLKRGERLAADKILAAAAGFESVDIDKSFFALRDGLQRIDATLVAAVQGTEVCPRDAADGEAFHYAGYLSPLRTKEVATLLGRVTFDRFFAAYSETEMGKGAVAGEREYLHAHFTELRTFLKTAGAEGLAVVVSHL